jgi:hypothetical protein
MESGASRHGTWRVLSPCRPLTSTARRFWATRITSFITPGYKSMRFAKPLKPGGLYRSYVKMLPTSEPNMYAGDVCILDGSDVVGMVERILFRKWLWAMINRFFVPPDMKKAVMSKSKSGDSRADKPVVTKNVCLPFERQSYADKNYPYVDNSHPPPGKNHLSPRERPPRLPSDDEYQGLCLSRQPRSDAKRCRTNARPMPNGVRSMPNGVRAMTSGVGSMVSGACGSYLPVFLGFSRRRIRNESSQRRSGHKQLILPS